MVINPWTDTINMFTKNYFLNIFSIMMFFKFVNKKTSVLSKVIISIFSLFFCIIYFFLKHYFDIVMGNIVVYFLQVILLALVTKEKNSSIFVGLIIAKAISYIVLPVAISVEFCIQKMLPFKNYIMDIIFVVLIEFLLISRIMRIKKLKNGLAFLSKVDDYVVFIVINICVVIIVAYGLSGYGYGKVIEHRYIYYAILAIFMVITIQKILTMHYKQKLINDTINQYKEELQQKDDEIKKLTDEAFRVNKINHEFYNRQKALELAVKNMTMNGNIEAGEELDITNRISEISKEHSRKMDELKNFDILPRTEIKEIDDMFSYMQSECEKSKINFKLKISGNIHFMINNLITKNKLETLIGDHMRDAIIAVNSSTNTNKEIMAILGVKDEIYELCIYDTGIEFELETLSKLGLQPATTHKESGGTGIGFMTTFETLKETGASLIIEELGPESDTNYTKSVTIRFDGKCEYNIKSYRAEKIKNKKGMERANLNIK